MYMLAQYWAESYMKSHPGVSIYCEGGGSGAGADALAAGSADICTASRPLRPEEAQLLAKKYGSVGLLHRVAKDALSIYLHPSNPVRSLTVRQLKQIYTGEITNWKEVGGDDAEIRILYRMPNSGTHLYLQEHVLDGEAYSVQSSKRVGSAFDMIENVKNTPNAIGYGGFLQQEGIYICKIDNVEPTAENVLNDSYPVTRYLYLYTPNTPAGHIRLFIEWVMGPQGQQIVKKAGFFPIWEQS